MPQSKCTCPHGRPWYAECYTCLMDRPHVRTAPVYMLTREGLYIVGWRILRQIPHDLLQRILD